MPMLHFALMLISLLNTQKKFVSLTSHQDFNRNLESL